MKHTNNIKKYYHKIYNKTLKLVIPNCPYFDPLEITLKRIFIDDDVYLFKIEGISDSMQRYHIWFINTDIIYPNACYSIQNKDYIKTKLNIKTSLKIHFNRIIDNFAFFRNDKNN